ncbi:MULTISPECIES: RbsD/FucU domain-containing protein [unclassified Chelatococcus]|uniref:RbsD/FucU family protein n=1 Tax=unclassified Chelatococcus TaxID=2638111 RepID=UPI001BCE073F|nr:MULTISPECIES: RbsD/FucU domain-containing protein [unclassified Chelatococcus]MBS7697250.1 fucose-binding protein [Chelatococcus sp. YT9]MBX3556453.1 fucose-binding protein [Chelatococcus sp.]
MLKGVDPLLTPDLLWVLAAMGHGDDIAIVDANFPAEAVARATASGRLVRLPELNLARAVRAVLSLLPIDDFVSDPVRRMEVVGDRDTVPPIQQEVQRVVDAAAGRALPAEGIERFAFYDAARKAFAVVQVGDLRPYGCFLVRKGVILAD